MGLPLDAVANRLRRIEADLRRPSLAAMLGIAGVVGLSELLSNSQDAVASLRELVVTPEVAGEAVAASPTKSRLSS